GLRGFSRSQMDMSSAGLHRINGSSLATRSHRCWRRPSRAAFAMRWRGVDPVTTRPINGTIAFQPRARLLKLIGEELISDEVVALSELVKNSHDADASSVSVTFRGVAGEAGSVEVRDDGVGMDVSTLLGRWMEAAAR